MKNELYIGKSIMVFDPSLWNKNGGDSKTDSFFRKATILKIYPEDTSWWDQWKKERFCARLLIDVQFEHNGHISRGHFASDIKDFYERPIL